MPKIEMTVVYEAQTEDDRRVFYKKNLMPLFGFGDDDRPVKINTVVSGRGNVDDGNAVEINDIKIGSIVTYRDGTEGEVFDITEQHYDGIDHGLDDKFVAQARIWTNHKGGGTYHTHRGDGISHHNARADIVSISTPKVEEPQ